MTDDGGRDPEIERLRRQIRGLWGAVISLWIVIMVGMISLFWWLPRTPGQRERSATLATRRLVIEDAKGVSRIELGIDDDDVAGIWLGSRNLREQGLSVIQTPLGPQFHMRGRNGLTSIVGSELTFGNRNQTVNAGIGLFGQDSFSVPGSGPAGLLPEARGVPPRLTAENPTLEGTACLA